MYQQDFTEATASHSSAVIGSWYANIDFEGLNIIKSSQVEYISIPNSQITGQEIYVNLPEFSKPISLTVESVQNLIKGFDVVTYVGTLKNYKNSSFTLSVAKEGVLGQIDIGSSSYVISPLKSDAGKHSITLLDKTLIIKDNNDDAIVDEKFNLQNTSIVKSGVGSGRVDILFYYASDVYWPTLYVSNIVSKMNTALAQSGVSSNNYIRSAGVKYLPTTFSGLCKFDILVYEMGAKQGVFSNIDQDMSQYGADIAFTILGDLSAQGCFTGHGPRVGGQAYLFSSNKPYAVTAQAYLLGDLTASHEIGHVLGGKHTNTYNSFYGTMPYAKGKTFQIGQNPKQTLMGSYDTSPCLFYGLPSNCERINYFSNPSIYYSGIPLGSNSRNMKNWLNYSMPIVSGYHGSATPVPGVPNPINAISEQCFGLNSVYWATKAGTTEYKVYKSTNSSFTAPTLIYSGSNTSSLVNVSGSSVWYVRVKACNASGCSAYSNQVNAYRLNNCL